MVNTALWLMPLVLLPGVALLVTSTATRYGQIHNEFHHLLMDEESTSTLNVADHLLLRSYLFRNALVSLYLSVAFFAIASLLGGVAAMLSQTVDWLVIGLAFMGILCLVFAAIELIRESLTSLKIIRQHHQKIKDRYER